MPNSRALVSLISALISQILALIFLILPSSDPINIADHLSSRRHDLQEIVFPLLHHFLFSSDLAASLSLLSFSNKRKRSRFQTLDESAAEDYGTSDSPPFRRFDSVVSRSPESFNQFFGMKISTFEWLCGLLEPLLDFRDPAESPLNLPAEVRLGIGVFRLATGADCPEISGRFGVSEAAAKFCVKQLCRVLCTNFRFWVGFPNQTELVSVSSQFETLTGMPNCCGIVSCARFDVEKAGSFDLTTENASQQESIAAQIVVDSSSRILSIIAGFRGSRTDLQALKSSSLFKDIESCVLLNSRPLRINDASIPQYLVGNGEYPLLSFLLVPFVNPETGSVEENFNKVHRSMCFSSLKVNFSLRKWGVLSRTIKDEHKLAVAYIGSCSILHNMLISREDYSTFSDDLGDVEFNSEHRSSLGKNVIEEKALIIRRVLATTAKKQSEY